MAHVNVRKLLRLNPGAAQHANIRREWIAHSIAEDNRDIPGLMATLTDDCVYEIAQWGAVWHGKDGAASFYTELLTAFPDIHFDLQHIVIGPQGVWESARVTGTHRANWLMFQAHGQYVQFDAQIFFPWDAAACKFRGETVFVTGLETNPEPQTPLALKASIAAP